MTDHAIENEIQAKGLTAPRITPDDIEWNISSEHYFRALDGVHGNAMTLSYSEQAGEALSLLTFCVLVLRNGFTVTGESACVSPENFDAELGRKIARQNAVNKVWPLMGYALKEQLHRGEGVGTCSNLSGLVLTEADAIADLKGEPRPDAGQEAIRRGMTFGEAIAMLKNGCRVARSGWNGKGIFIELQVPDANSKMTIPYIFIDTTGLQSENHFAPRSRVPWLASQTDMLSEDWQIV